MTSIASEPSDTVQNGSSHWTYLTNHAHVLLAIARDHDVRLREIAAQVGITERAVQKIIAELEEAGALTKSRDGRRNHYEVNANVSLRHPMESHRTLDALVRMVHGDQVTAETATNGHGSETRDGHGASTLPSRANGGSNGSPNSSLNGNARVNGAVVLGGSLNGNGLRSNGHR